MKPLIGITMPYEPLVGGDISGERATMRLHYPQGVHDAGGIPVLLPPMLDPSEVLESLDGLLIPGGLDIPQSKWGLPPHPLEEPIQEKRFEFETALLRQAPKDFPILGICYGSQLMNFVSGGKSIPHLPDVVGHDRDQKFQAQEYSIVPNTLLSSIVGEEPVTGSSAHHQAIASAGEGIIVSARNSDGIVEAIEDPSKTFWLGVQWHPDADLGQPASIAIFEAIVKAALRYKNREKTCGTW